MAKLLSDERYAVRGNLVGIELITDRDTKEPFDEASDETQRELGY